MVACRWGLTPPSDENRAPSASRGVFSRQAGSKGGQGGADFIKQNVSILSDETHKGVRIAYEALHGTVQLVSPSRSTRFEGRSGMIDLFEGLRQWDSFAGCQHFSSQMRIEPSCTGRCHVRTFCGVVACRGEPPYRLQFAGRSDDLVVRIDDRWRFERRIVRLWAGHQDHSPGDATQRSWDA